MKMKKRILLPCLTAAMAATAQSTDATQPNIVLFMVDDMGWQDTSLPFFSGPTPLNARYRTPNMERLAARGMQFTSAYACAISSPSRCSLMTGMNQTRHRVTNWTKERDTATDDPADGLILPDWNVNGIQPVDTIPHSAYCTPLPELLRRAGYNTIHVGKAHYGAFGTPSADPRNIGFDVSIAGTAAGGPPQGGYLGRNRYGHRADGSPISSYAIPDLERYWDTDTFLTEALTREALHAADSIRTDGRPFFLYLAHYAVHVPFDADDRFTANYPDLDEEERRYATLIEGMDKSLGDVMDYLDATGQTDNTVIIFMSDNGGLDFYARGALPETTEGRHNLPLRSGKGSAYEGGIREPMIVSWPGVTPAASQCPGQVIIEDFFPTILEIAGTAAPTVQHVDGTSFVPLLRGGSLPDRPLIWHTPNNWTNMISEPAKRTLGIGPTSAIRLGDYKLIYFWADGSKELYNISTDIGETVDLAPSFPTLTATLSRILSDRLREAGAQRPARPDGTPLPWPDQMPPHEECQTPPADLHVSPAH